jgi:hypothetical protein
MFSSNEELLIHLFHVEALTKDELYSRMTTNGMFTITELDDFFKNKGVIK